LDNVFGYLNGVPVPVSIAPYDSPSIYKEDALFGDLTYHFTERFDAGVGMRLSHDQQTFSQEYGGLVGGTNLSGVESDETVKTYLATLRYHLTDSSMIYARAASGYRPGGPNVQITDPKTGLSQGAANYKPDSLWNYEVGLKLSPMPSLTLDLAVFHILWKDIQLASSVDGFAAYINGGRAKSDGVEASVAYQLLQGLTLSASGAYINARLADDVPGIGGLADDRLPLAPQVSGTLRADYRRDLGGGWNAFGGVNLSYEGNRPLTFNANPFEQQYDLPAYTTVNLHLGTARNGLEFKLYAKNLFNKLGQNSADTSNAPLSYLVALTQPRTVGAEVTLNF
jgi:outer membrane receptor protein involved in Fe transport